MQWLETVQAATSAGLLHFQAGGGTHLEAVGSTARLVLHPHGQRMAICYPLLVGCNNDSTQYDYVWHTQLFSCSEVPARWQAAWSVAQAASKAGHRIAARRQVQDSSKVPDGQIQAAGVKEEQNEGGAFLSILPSAVPQAQPSGDLMSFTSADPWWLNGSSTLLPATQAVHFEWTSDATYQFIQATQVSNAVSHLQKCWPCRTTHAHHSPPPQGLLYEPQVCTFTSRHDPDAHSQEVEAWVHADESCLRTTQQGRFLSHHRGGHDSVSIFAVDAVPSHVWDADGHPCYALAPIAGHACLLRSGSLPIPDAESKCTEAIDLANHLLGWAWGYSHNAFIYHQREVRDNKAEARDCKQGQGSAFAHLFSAAWACLLCAMLCLTVVQQQMEEVYHGLSQLVNVFLSCQLL